MYNLVNIRHLGLNQEQMELLAVYHYANENFGAVRTLVRFNNSLMTAIQLWHTTMADLLDPFTYGDVPIISEFLDTSSDFTDEDFECYEPQTFEDCYYLEEEIELDTSSDV